MTIALLFPNSNEKFSQLMRCHRLNGRTHHKMIWQKLRYIKAILHWGWLYNDTRSSKQMSYTECKVLSLSFSCYSSSVRVFKAHMWQAFFISRGLGWLELCLCVSNSSLGPWRWGGQDAEFFRCFCAWAFSCSLDSAPSLQRFTFTGWGPSGGRY